MRNKKLLFALLAIVVLAISGLSLLFFNRATLLSSTQKIIPGKELSFETIRGPSDVQTERKNHVINSSADWANYSGEKIKLSAPQKPESPPEIDLTKHTVIAVHMGSCPTPGYSIKITKVVEYPLVAAVFVKETPRGEGGYFAQMITYPSHAIKVQKINKKVLFSTENKVEECKSITPSF